ncbi:MAG: MoxR family ATPase [Prevotella sp.]|nr:MoxR family ATPase [Prevotella sp.]MBQ4484252.1 MoxR family ATPase [Prevotella sp.]
MAESIDIRELNLRIEQESGFVTNLVTGMNRVIVGQRHLVDSLLIGLLSDGHILLEGVPGLAKTLAIKTLAQLIDADYSRIQFTPDLLPADVIGTMIYSQKEENFLVKRGPVFANFVLADEINRAPAKVQSALLEAMQEHQVTIGEKTFVLPNPFLVMATQNPIEQEGTYQLPEAQVDRFMLKVIIDYPSLEEEKLIIRENLAGALPEVKPVTTAEEILRARRIVGEVYIDEKIEQYIADIVFATRYPERYGLPEVKDMITFGGSPRASINLAKAARAYAFIKRRGYVVPEDVRAVAHDVLRHRIGLSYEAEAANITSEEIVSKVINKVEVP